MGIAPRCMCDVCHTLAAPIYRAWMLDIYAGREEAETLAAERWHQYSQQQKYVATLLPSRAVRTAWCNARDTEPLLKLRAWYDGTDDDQRMAVLAGQTGTGKTVAAAWLALHRMADIGTLRFITCADLSRVPRYGEERTELLEADVLILDDLGMEHDGGARFRADFDELVDRVYSRDGYLIITTNLGATEFRKRYGKRVVDRFAERGTWIPATGKSLRRRAA